jgi:hypothetical protein
LALIPDPKEEQKRIIRAAMTNKSRFDELEPFKPWTWFTWASKPTPKWIMRAIADGKITTEEDDGQKLLKQWEGQAGFKFTEDLEGLTNLFLAIRNGWFGDIEKSDAAIAKRIGTLFDIDKVMGQPWKWLSKNFADQTDIDKYLSSETARRHLMHRQDKAREPAIEVPPVPQGSQERSWKWNPDAESAYGGDDGY